MENDELTPMQYKLWHYVYGAFIQFCSVTIMWHRGFCADEWNNSITVDDITNTLVLWLKDEEEHLQKRKQEEPDGDWEDWSQQERLPEFYNMPYRQVFEYVRVTINAMAETGWVKTGFVDHGPRLGVHQIVWVDELVGDFNLYFEPEEVLRCYKKHLQELETQKSQKSKL
jgi:hypothetical protein